MDMGTLYYYSAIAGILDAYGDVTHRPYYFRSSIEDAGHAVVRELDSVQFSEDMDADRSGSVMLEGMIISLTDPVRVGDPVVWASRLDPTLYDDDRPFEAEELWYDDEGPF
jgi:hypothetical protein